MQTRDNLYNVILISFLGVTACINQHMYDASFICIATNLILLLLALRMVLLPHLV